MSNFNLGYQIGGAPSYQLSTNQRKSKVVQPLDGIQVHVNEAFKFQTLKMPDYCHFQSNVLTLPANEYSFSLEQQALSKYKGLLEENRCVIVQSEFLMIVTKKKDCEVCGKKSHLCILMLTN